MDDLQQCSKESFYEFIKNKNYKTIDGYTTHSQYYVDEKGNKMAYLETSSWGAKPIYKIKGGFCNFEDYDFIKQLLNN